MAEKEERIYVFKFEDDPCKDCEVKEINPDCSCCPDKEEYSRGISRQEAIERMAKAYIDYDLYREDKNAPLNPYKAMEKALNALLEVEK